MYIEQVRNSTNSFWLYIIGVFILGVVIIIGNIPFGFLILAEAGVDATQLTLA